ncbi:hypothetical protein P8C59_008133 [Phyllachora maydis]|uniref:Methyltransferase n=1 Tax=Phyllachora maydis TaxID=1825666 RepID=A0AAD9MGE5_9PEZI|nr:hypothetical protein P8C59_008133 [Phyllachora maydis]
MRSIHGNDERFKIEPLLLTLCGKQSSSRINRQPASPTDIIELERTKQTRSSTIKKMQDTAPGGSEHPHHKEPPAQHDRFRSEFGRWYLQPGWRYLLPIDEDEKDRLDMFQQIISEALRGIWAIEVADKCRPVQVIGVDIQMSQPEQIPKDLSFVEMDVEEDWSGFLPDSFDLVHLRCMLGSIGDWSRLYSRVISHLKPSCGWIEHEEIDWTFRSDDGTLQDDNFAKTWQELYFDAMDRAGRSVRIDPRLTRRRLEQSGFVDIELEVVKLPCNGWPQDAAERGLGRWFNLGISYSIEPFSLAPLCVFSNYSADDARRMKARVQAAISAREVHAYCNLYIWTARKR